MRLSGIRATFTRDHAVSSGHSYYVITPISVKGIIGSIKKIMREDFVKETDHLKIAIVVCNPIYMDIESHNYHNLKPGKGNGTIPTPRQVLYNVCYEVYIYDPYNPEGIYVPDYEGYSTYFGKRDCPASWEKSGYYLIEEKDKVKNITTNAVIKYDKMKLNNKDDDNNYIIERRLPTNQNLKREYIKASEVVFTKDGNPLNCDIESVSYVDNRYVHFF